jgi:hypothetical protein
MDILKEINEFNLRDDMHDQYMMSSFLTIDEALLLLDRCYED